jgi:hypothetical protein
MRSNREQLRMEILLDGLIDAVGLPRIHNRAEWLNPGATASELQKETIESIRWLADKDSSTRDIPIPTASSCPCH